MILSSFVVPTIQLLITLKKKKDINILSKIYHQFSKKKQKKTSNARAVIANDRCTSGRTLFKKKKKKRNNQWNIALTMTKYYWTYLPRFM